MSFGIWDLGFGIWGLGFGIWGLGFSGSWSAGLEARKISSFFTGLGHRVRLVILLHMTEAFLEARPSRPTRPTSAQISIPGSQIPKPKVEIRVSSLDSASTTTGLCMVEAGIFGLDDAHPSTSDLGFEI